MVWTPAKYNRTYETMRYHGKLNRILAWGHAQAIENILAEEPCEHVISDQFAPERFIRRALSVRGINVAFEQRPHAEDDIAVAAASILARDAYIKSLESLSAEYFIDLTPGASQKVIDTGREFVLRHGVDKLKEVAKLHFVTTQYVLNPEMVRETQQIDFTPDYFLSIDD
jgi:ribonuclease HIII